MTVRCLSFGVSTGLALLLASSIAGAQTPAESPSLQLGAWRFRPLIEVRIRAAYRTHPVDLGGVTPTHTALLAEETDGQLPSSRTTDDVDTNSTLEERARLGLAVMRGPVLAQFTLQDTRELGTTDADRLTPIGRPALPSLAPFEAYAEIHGDGVRATYLRLGRQRVVWGDGRLLGESDFAASPRSLDAVRFFTAFGDLDLEVLGVMLAPPGKEVVATETDEATPDAPPKTRFGQGSTLAGVKLGYHVAPLFFPEISAIGRFVRDPVPSWLAPSDVIAFDARVSGDYRGVSYSAEGVYELGRVSAPGQNRDLRAYAGAGRLAWETSLPWHLTFGAQGAYATGESGALEPSDVQRRFDPLLPEEHDLHGMLDLCGWSNIIEAGGGISARPSEDLTAKLDYRLAMLAKPRGRWSSASLAPIGKDVDNTARLLGHEVDLLLSYTRWDAVTFDAGYGLFLFGDGAKAALTASFRGAPSMQHGAFFQTTVSVP